MFLFLQHVPVQKEWTYYHIFPELQRPYWRRRHVAALRVYKTPRWQENLLNHNGKCKSNTLIDLSAIIMFLRCICICYLLTVYKEISFNMTCYGKHYLCSAQLFAVLCLVRSNDCASCNVKEKNNSLRRSSSYCATRLCLYYDDLLHNETNVRDIFFIKLHWIHFDQTWSIWNNRLYKKTRSIILRYRGTCLFRIFQYFFYYNQTKFFLLIYKMLIKYIDKP